MVRFGGEGQMPERRPPGDARKKISIEMARDGFNCP